MSASAAVLSFSIPSLVSSSESANAWASLSGSGTALLRASHYWSRCLVGPPAASRLGTGLRLTLSVI
ncbi:hypothetical protein NL676_029222 [Syzygium grande]|nr:hypothetical protein NL676_029222 [Syzygium grande]